MVCENNAPLMDSQLLVAHRTMRAAVAAALVHDLVSVVGRLDTLLGLACRQLLQQAGFGGDGGEVVTVLKGHRLAFFRLLRK